MPVLVVIRPSLPVQLRSEKHLAKTMATGSRPVQCQSWLQDKKPSAFGLRRKERQPSPCIRFRRLLALFAKVVEIFSSIQLRK
jgi:hypothetical protein